LSHTSSPFHCGYFGGKVSRTICLDWPQTAILLISASQLARITDVTHQHQQMLWFKEICLGVKLTKDRLVMINLNCQLD
jgi:hypothetical protein